MSTGGSSTSKYDELYEGLKRNLKLVEGGKKSVSQPWFSENLAKLRKSMHRAEADWLKKKGSSDQGNSIEMII